METITVVGLGYVGLPLSSLCLQSGYKVFGLDVDEDKISLLKKNESPISDSFILKGLKDHKTNFHPTLDPKECVPHSDIVIICVPTPVDKNNYPNLTALKSSIETVAPLLKQDSLLIVESTIYPGTVDEVVLPILKKHGSKVLVAHVPERIDPGNSKWGIESIPRVVGGIDKESVKRTSSFYKSIINGEIIELDSVKAAEATKIMENTFRDINIAFVNEMAKSFDKMGIDINEVIRGASTKPFAFMPHYPGAGVGGHCIAQDPYYMIEKGNQIGFDHEFLKLARRINNSMPSYTVSLLEAELEKNKKKLKGAKVGVLGLAYKPNIEDTRESPGIKIVDILKTKGARVLTYDPFVTSDAKDLKSLLSESDYVVLATAHSEFKKIDGALLKQNNIGIVIDGRSIWNKEKIKQLGIAYRGIGSK